MTTPRWGHTCSLVTLDDGKKEIVIVGGRTSAGNDPDDCTIGNTITLRDVEILNLETNSIRAGPKLPVYVRHAGQVRVGNTFWVIGGTSCLEPGATCSECRGRSTIYKYNTDETWTQPQLSDG